MCAAFFPVALEPAGYRLMLWQPSCHHEERACLRIEPRQRKERDGQRPGPDSATGAPGSSST